jgi:hypothetical protein
MCLPDCLHLHLHLFWRAIFAKLPRMLKTCLPYMQAVDVVGLGLGLFLGAGGVVLGLGCDVMTCVCACPHRPQYQLCVYPHRPHSPQCTLYCVHAVMQSCSHAVHNTINVCIHAIHQYNCVLFTHSCSPPRDAYVSTVSTKVSMCNPLNPPRERMCFHCVHQGFMLAFMQRKGLWRRRDRISSSGSLIHPRFT